jgi:hypothetical protein
VGRLDTFAEFEIAQIKSGYREPVPTNGNGIASNLLRTQNFNLRRALKK